MRQPFNRTGFTLIELLVLIAIIGIVVSLLLPAVQKVRETVARTQCANNLKQIGLACHHYHDTNGSLPSGYRAADPYVDGATDTAPGWGWAPHLLPFLEQGNLYRSLNLALPVEHPDNAAAIKTVVKTFLCSSDLPPPAAGLPIVNGVGTTLAMAAPCSYAGVAGGDESECDAPAGLGLFFRNSAARFADVTDGATQTLMVGERSWGNAQGIWAGAISGGVIQRGPRNPNPGSAGSTAVAPVLVLAHSHLINPTNHPDAGLDDFSSSHPAGANFLFADGSVHFIRSIPSDQPDGGLTPEGTAFTAMGTRGGGETIADLDF